MDKTLELINKKMGSGFTTITPDGQWREYEVYDCWYGDAESHNKDVGYPVTVIVKGDSVKRADVKAIMKDRFGIK